MGSRLGATGGPTGGPTPGLDTPPQQVFSPTPPPQRASSGLLATNHGGGSPRDLLYDCSPGSAAHRWDSGSVRLAARRQDSTGGPMSGLDDFSIESDEIFSTATVNPTRGRWPENPHQKSVQIAVKSNGNASNTQVQFGRWYACMKHTGLRRHIYILITCLRQSGNRSVSFD